MSISFMVGPHRVRFAGKTDIGLVRAHNEDSLLIPREMALAVVSDGMGGHAAGDVASRITVETIDQHYRDTARSGPNTWPFKLPSLEIEKQRMSVAIQLANSNIFETAAADGSKKGMGCTVDAIYFNQGRFFIGHVGDSRVYRIREGRIQMLTEDHSLLNDYLRMKELSGDEGVHFPQKNVVVRALGLADQVHVDVIADAFQVGDVFLLCSDGLSGMLDDRVLLDIITARDSLDTSCNELIKAANDAGGNDNITAILIRIEKP
ncbi:Stp1/IreP family PP2C-type Ser/Thr phosphatase [Nannocystis sp. SCPEA4]|uniref:Stp1/IreP family PP2C-type Ser/Thr phosphatase n=1 Tax=Nannocystis sp. SCPEA4 TaxID=2996787 RepID=UPI00227075B4|nr:Stp1/IreP family PP2C-type Ser/Thr phosphatase [Nannocystis sp. SCPEA4]MCY1061047.1 Stp1/IreP family PP2C-type Ser/Thr phosphatase [Nannocystis sp. SCPEA4]